MTMTASRPTSDRPASPRPASAGASSVGPRIDPMRVLRQNQWKIVIAGILGVGVGVAAKIGLDQTYPLYSGQVLFELRSVVQDPSDLQAREERSEEAVERLGQTESARLLSRPLLEQALRNRDVEGTTWATKFLDDAGVFDVPSAVDELLDELSASYRRRTQYFQLSWSTHVPGDVPIVLNRIADTYIAVKGQQDSSRFEKNRVLYQKQLDSLNTDLATIQRQIGDHIRATNLTTSSSTAMPTDITAAMEDTMRNINETQAQLSIATSRRDQTKAKIEGRLAPSSEDMRRAEEDPIVLRLSSTVKDLRIGYENDRDKFGDTHPQLRTSKRLYEAAEAERDSEIKRIVENNLHADFKLYSDQSQSYAQLLQQYQEDYTKKETALKDSASNQTTLAEMQDKQARLQESRSRVLDLIGALDTLKMREDARAVTIAQSCSTPREKSFPKWSVMVALGGLAGILLMLGFAFLREILDQRVRYASDLSGIPGRILGIVPDVEEDPTGIKRAENAIREAPQSVVAETLRQATGQILKQLKSGSHRTLLVFGGMPGAGVTAILTNLAESMAWGGKRVLLVDANFRRPGLAAALGADPDAPGFGELLTGKVTMDKAVRELSERIHLIGAGAPEHRVYERLSTQATDDVLARLRDQYDIVLLDAPPAVVAGDAIALAGKVDATVLVVRAFQEQRGLVSRLVHQLHDMPSSFLGIILNRPRSAAGGYFRKNFETMASYAGKK
jgi:succinoglycan biosynthesis transport protein ExoP